MSLIAKFIYVALFAVLLAQPHVFRGHLLAWSSPLLHNAITVVVIGVAALVYRLHVADIRKRERQNLRLQQHLDCLDERLVEAFKYIGLVNVRLPLLRQLTSELLGRATISRRQKKSIFEQLVEIASTSIAKTSWAMLRCVDVSRVRTVHEFFFGDVAPQPVSNKTIMNILTHPGGSPSAAVEVISSSDPRAQERYVLLLPPNPGLSRDERTVLQVIVDQAQLFHGYLFHNSGV